MKETQLDHIGTVIHESRLYVALLYWRIDSEVPDALHLWFDCHVVY